MAKMKGDQEVWVTVDGRRFIVRFENGRSYVMYERMSKDLGPAAGGSFVYNVSRWSAKAHGRPCSGIYAEALIAAQEKLNAS